MLADTSVIHGFVEQMNLLPLGLSELSLGCPLWLVWFVCLANQTGVDLTKAFEASLEKKRNRDKDRFKKERD